MRILLYWEFQYLHCADDGKRKCLFIYIWWNQSHFLTSFVLQKWTQSILFCQSSLSTSETDYKHFDSCKSLRVWWVLSCEWISIAIIEWVQCVQPCIKRKFVSNAKIRWKRSIDLLHCQQQISSNNLFVNHFVKFVNRCWADFILFGECYFPLIFERFIK